MFHELRLSLRHWSSWLCTVALSLLVVLLVLTAGDNKAYIYWYDVLFDAVANIIFFQFPLIAATGAWILLRHRPQGFDWAWATPQDSYHMLGKQMLALMIQVLLIHWITLSVLWSMLMLRGETNFSSGILIYGYGFLLLLPATFVQLGIIVLLTLLFQQLLFVIGSVLGLSIMLWLGLLMPVATLFKPLNLTWLTVSFNPITTFGPDTRLILNLSLVYSMVGIVLWSLGLLIAQVRDQRIRLRRHSRLLLNGTLSVSLLVAGAAGILHHHAVAQQKVPASRIDQYKVWQVEHAATELKLANEELAYIHQVTVRNTSNEALTTLVLQLNPGLSVNRARVDGSKAISKRIGETIQLTLREPIQPQQTLILELSIAGKLHLLREDYASAMGIESSEAATYKRPVRNYHDKALFLLGRDGDWRAWPLGDSIQQATESDSIDLDTTGFEQPLLTSAPDQSTTYTWNPAAAENTNDEQALDIQATQHRWEQPLPELLAVGGDYSVRTGEIADYMQSTQANDHDQAYIEQITRLYTSLRGLDPNLPERPQIVQVPYLDRILLGGGLIAIPLQNPTQAFETKLLPNEYWELRPLAQQLSYAWFASNAQIVLPLSTTGQLITYEQRCDAPNAEGEQKCRLIYDQGNSQVVQPRLVPKYTVDPPVYAASVVLGQYLAATVSNDQQSKTDEQKQWRAIIDPRAPMVSYEQVQQLLDQSGLYLRGQFDFSDSTIANMVVDTHSLLRCYEPVTLFTELHAQAQQRTDELLKRGEASCE